MKVATRIGGEVLAQKKTDPVPSELELQILGILWETGPSTVRDVLDGLNDGKDRGYTAVLSVLQAMQKKKLVSAKQVRGQRAYQYTAKKTRESIVGPMFGGFVQRIFGGDPAAAVQQLLSSSDLDADAITRLRDVIQEAEERAEK